MYRQRGQSARALTTLHHLLDTYPPGEEPQMALHAGRADAHGSGAAASGGRKPALAAPPRPAQCRGAVSPGAGPIRAGRYAEATTAAAEQALAIDGSHQASRQLLAQLAASIPGRAAATLERRRCNAPATLERRIRPLRAAQNRIQFATFNPLD